MKRILLSMLAVAILSIGSLGSAQAQELQTVATISISGYDELLADVDFIGKLGDNAGLAEGLEAMIQMATQGQGLAGLDKTKPIGAVIQTDGMGFPAYAFIPVTDLGELVSLVMSLQGAEPPEEPADGIYELEFDGQTLFATQKGGWAFVSNERATLAGVPDDPSLLLAGLSDKYDVAVRASVKNVPAPMKDMAKASISFLRMGATQQNPGEGDEEFALRKLIMNNSVKRMTTLIDEVDELLLGVAIDRNAGTSSIDFEITALDGTKTAEQFAQMVETTTDFAGFDLPGAAMTANLSGMFSDVQVAQLKETLAQRRTTALKEIENQDLSEDDVAIVKGLLNDLLDVADATIDGRKMDAGMVVMLQPGKATLVAGGSVAKGDTLEGLLKQMANMGVTLQPDLAQFLKLDAETYQGVRLHTFSMPTPDPEAAKAIGETVEAVVGINDTSIYAAVGSDAISTLKQVIDQSKTQPGKKVPPMRIVIAATPIANFVASAAPDGDPSKMMAGMVAGMLQQTGGQDKLTITMEGITNGVRTRFEIEKGLMQLIGMASQMFGQMTGFEFDGDPPPVGDSPF
ncbi:MAG: hypothetical protein V3R99_06315 [Thermoguttaceae bacterium]